jgi:similar to stage IV sporulation protein
MPEKLINILWRNGILVREIKKINVTSLVVKVDSSDYAKIKEYCDRTGCKIRIIDKKGLRFFALRFKDRVALLLGVFLFSLILYYLSTFIWKINITSDGSISPYEIRKELKDLGIYPGISKSKINTATLEETLLKTGNLIWAKLRINGSILEVSIAERQTPPEITDENAITDLVAKRDCLITRIYTTSGTASVKPGDTVKAGQKVIIGLQGKEGNTVTVPAKGEVMATTWYESFENVKGYATKKIRTGNKIVNYYLSFGQASFCIKNNLNNYKSYDRMEEGSLFIKRITFYETKEEKENLNIKDLVDKTSEKLFNNMILSLDKSVKLVDKKIDYTEINDEYKIRVMLTIEENVAVPETTK